LKEKTTIEEINKKFLHASENEMEDVLVTSDEPLVSSDLVMNPASSIVDLSLTQVVKGDLIKVIAWYDNEWGYSNRLVELAEYIVKN
jgi:glyceraldehyde-3-phosphate dehydrogenase (NAD(P))